MFDNKAHAIALRYTADCVIYDELTALVRDTKGQIGSAKLSIELIDSQIATIPVELRDDELVKTAMSAVTKLRDALKVQVEDKTALLNDAEAQLAAVSYVMQ